jgi:RNA polymerase sigma factor (sigma-70 family)
MVAGPGRESKVERVRHLDSEPHFNRVYRSEYSRLVRLATILVGRRDVAEELVQETFLDAHRKWSRLHSYDRPDAWLRRGVLQRSMRHRGRVQKESALIARLVPARWIAAESWATVDPALFASISRLPRRQAQVLVLVVIDDCSFAEVATILKCSEETARTHYRRARTRLRGELASRQEP